jgi:hypothetical protein
MQGVPAVRRLSQGVSDTSSGNGTGIGTGAGTERKRSILKQKVAERKASAALVAVVGESAYVHDVATQLGASSGLHRDTHLTTANRIQEEAAAAAAVRLELLNEARYRQQIALKAKLAQRKNARDCSADPLASIPAPAAVASTVPTVASAAASAAPTARHDDTSDGDSDSDSDSDGRSSSEGSISDLDTSDDDDNEI